MSKLLCYERVYNTTIEVGTEETRKKIQEAGNRI